MVTPGTRSIRINGTHRTRIDGSLALTIRVDGRPALAVALTELGPFELDCAIDPLTASGEHEIEVEVGPTWVEGAADPRPLGCQIHAVELSGY
ncbi:MAG: hypothetical protein E6G56_09700 [Actinobacteria bacterium]|nr:MAG: hypothetical protein E6G56_09700 [Actinomycetota bacterium]